jgi:O-antigen/teichoic acid export membrane protein
MSITLLFLIFQTSLTGIFAKFAAKFIAQKNEKSFSALYNKGFKFVLFFSSIIFIALLVGTPILKDFLHVENIFLLMGVYVYIFFSILSSLPAGILQGEIRVFFFSFLNIFAAILKIFIAIFLVLSGMRVGGAIFAICVSIVIPFIVSTYIVKRGIPKNNTQDINSNFLASEFKNYGYGYFLATLGTTIFLSVDTILARHFFSPNVAGFYAALSLMGKSIFYFIFPINFVLFPLAAAKYEKKENVFEVLMLAGLLVITACISASFIYFLFPGFVLSIFFPKAEYAHLTQYLGPFSLFILIFSLASIMSGFLLSIGKTQIYKINLSCGIIFIFMLYLFHESFYQMINVMFLTSLLLFVLLLIYYFKNAHGKVNDKTS